MLSLSAAALWIVEGLLMYLSTESVALFLRTIYATQREKSGSCIVGDVLNAAHMTSAMTAPLRDVWGKWAVLPQSGLAHPEAFFADIGFGISVFQLGVDIDYGRTDADTKAFWLSHARPTDRSADDPWPRNLLFRGNFLPASH